MNRNDIAWIALVVAAVVIVNLLQKTNVSSSDALSGGQGVDPFDESTYTVENLAELSGLI